MGILPEDCEVSYAAGDTTAQVRLHSSEDVAEAVNATTEDEQAEDAAADNTAFATR